MKIKENSKIHIVGAGIAGMTAAINLSKFGKSVIIYEKNERLLSKILIKVYANILRINVPYFT